MIGYEEFVPYNEPLWFRLFEIINTLFRVTLN